MMALYPAHFGPVLLGLSLLLSAPPPLTAWDADLELFDLVEEIPQTFYQFMNLDQDAAPAEIKKAYRRLSLSLHPDKNKDENAETQFRQVRAANPNQRIPQTGADCWFFVGLQLVAIYEVLKDEERRRRYDDILVNGLPDWRQPVFYYRRVRKMSNAELGFLLFLILTVGHYAVIWSIYLEKQLDELLSKKKKDKKKKMNSRPVDDLRCIGQDQTERNQERPHWQDILPLKLSIWLYLSIKNLPQTLQEVKQYYEEYQQMKRQQEEEAASEQEVAPREKRTKVRKPKVEFPVYEIPADSQNYQMYDQATSIEEIEDQMDDWLQDGKASKKKASAWTEEEMSLLSRLMGKFPGGSPGRWEKIAHELGRSVSDVTAKVKQVKDNVNHTPGLVKFSDLKGHHGKPLPAHDSVPGVGVEQEQEETQKDAALPARRRNKEGAEAKVRSRRQRDFDPNAVEREEAEPQDNVEKSHASTWTQNQQKLLELALQQFPRGTAERWDRIAKVVPGKTKVSTGG
uniref:DnaJ (Hsp40) homolog, subfamily C, member 1 n=1 Tax=Oryzias sinensis TaxID=183150 RepID=A0A8C7XJX5_9TELE